MTYPNAHLYLTIHWSPASVPNEVGQTGLRFDTVAAASQSLVDACAGPVSTFWTTVIAGIDFDYKLQFLRLASIAPNGQYVPGTLAYDHIYAGGVGGGGSGGTAIYRYPLQTAWASRLLTAFPRGQAHEGRIYLPPSASALVSGYSTGTVNANNRSNPLSAMLTALNTAMPGPVSIFSKGTKLAPTVGAKHAVTGVQTGTRLDVQRRRGAQQPETQGTVWVV